MVFEKIENEVWKPEEVDEEIIGVFISSDKDVGVNNSIIYHLEVESKPVSVWGSAVLDAKMIAVKPGNKLKIVYKGKGEAKAGKNPPKLFDVYVDRDKPLLSDRPFGGGKTRTNKGMFG